MNNTTGTVAADEPSRPSRDETLTISVIVPTRNRSHKMIDCLASLARQTLPNFETIVVDDGSTDETANSLSRFATEHPELRLTILRNDQPIGANPSRNRGIQASYGEFIAFIDDDCIADPDWLEQLLERFDSDDVAAVTGHVENVKPRNLFELTLKGTQRVHGDEDATRLVGCNMCVRRELVLMYMFDEDRAKPISDMSVSGRGDEEGLFLQLRDAGYRQKVARSAKVLHDHPYNARSFCRQAYRSGKSTARVGYKYGLLPRVELMPLIIGYLILPLGLVHILWLAVALALASLFMAAILYNDFSRKRKTISEILLTLPLLLLYYHLRAAGYCVAWMRLWCGVEKIEQVGRTATMLKSGKVQDRQVSR